MYMVKKILSNSTNSLLAHESTNHGILCCVGENTVLFSGCFVFVRLCVCVCFCMRSPTSLIPFCKSLTLTFAQVRLYTNYCSCIFLAAILLAMAPFCFFVGDDGIEPRELSYCSSALLCLNSPSLLHCRMQI